jgi:hypothetical protein
MKVKLKLINRLPFLLVLAFGIFLVRVFATDENKEGIYVLYTLLYFTEADEDLR